MTSVLFLGKADDPHCARALAFLEANCVVQSHLGKWGDPLPVEAERWSGQYIISYLSRWLVPAALIERASTAAINFHPASPHYPGVGCNNFALYEDAKEYGATCHFMASKVDTGAIIATTSFPVLASDDVASLLARTYDYQLVLFYEIAGRILWGEELTPSGETWTRRPFTRKEFNALSVIGPDMEPAEIERRIRATRFGSWRPYVEVGGRRFELT